MKPPLENFQMNTELSQQPDRASSAVAVVGCGYWGKNLVRTFSNTDSLAALHDSDAASSQRLGNEYNVPVMTWDKILSDQNIGAVALSTPAATHAALAREALSAGKDVFVEKPLALRVEEAEELVSLARCKQRVLMVGHLLQYHPAFLRLKEIVTQGELGRLQYIYSSRLNLGKFRQEEDILWSFAPHDISMILSLMDQEPSRVEAVGSTFLHKSIADTTITHLSFSGGQSAHIFVSWLHPYKEQKLIVIGENGMIVFDDTLPWESKLQRYDHKITWKDGRPHPEKNDAVPILLTPEEPLKCEVEHFLHCLRTRETPRTCGDEGLRVLKVLQSATISLREHTKSGALPALDAGATPDSATMNEGVQIHSTSCVDEDVTIGNGTHIWHFSHVLSGVQIGTDCNIGQNVVIGPNVSIGKKCKIQNNVSVFEGVTLEDEVFCGPSCVFTNVSNPRADINKRDEFELTLVGTGATIGANATILCGTTLGHHCFIAAGAVITKDVPPFALMAGVPAKRIGWVSRSGERLGEDMTCPRLGKKYREIGENILEEVVK